MHRSFNYMSSLYTLYINLVSDIWIAHIFSSVGCLFILLMVPFASISFYFYVVPLILALSLLLGHIKKNSPRWMSRSLNTPYVFLWKFYDFRSYIHIFNPFWVHFLYGISFVWLSQNGLLKRVPFAYCVFLHIIYHKLIICAWILLLGFFFLFHWSMCLFLQASTILF